MLCPNPRILHVPLYIQVLALIVWGRYICMKKEENSASSFTVQSSSMNLDVP